MIESTVLYFGKLPHYGDFVRFNAIGPDIRDFDRWLQEGLYLADRHFSSEWSTVYQNAHAYQFFFHADNWESALIGFLMRSYDRSERKYPFVVAQRIDKKQIEPRMIPLVPMMFAAFFRESQQVVLDGMNGIPLLDISHQTESLPRFQPGGFEGSLQTFEDYIRSTTMEQFWSHQFGNFSDLRKFLLLKNLIDVLQPLAFGRPAHISLGVRFPLSPMNSSRNEEACFWSLVAYLILRGFHVLPNMFFGISKGGERTYLYLFLGRPPTKSLIFLARPTIESDAICRLEEDGNKDLAQASQRLPQKYRIALEWRNLTLKGFLETIGAGSRLFPL